MKRILFTFLSLWMLNPVLFSQLSPISTTDFTLVSVSSDNSNHPAAHALDNDIDTWWALYNADGYDLPGVIEIDLGASYDVASFSYMPNYTSPEAKALNFELYVSDDPSDWGTAQAAGAFPWFNDNDTELKMIHFGTVNGRYVKMVYPSSLHPDGNIHTTELVFFESDTPPTGQLNQTIEITAIEDKFATDPDFEIMANASSGLPLSFEILSGPATLDGNSISLTGTSGRVNIKATQEGDATYYPVETQFSFQVYNLNDYYPSLTTRLSEAYPIEMDELSVYPIYIQTSIDELVGIDHVEVEINGSTYPTIQKGEYFYYLWTPDAYGNHEININSIGTNGNTTTETRNVNVTDNYESQTVTSMEDVVIWFNRENSRWYYGDYSLPQHVGAYDKIMAYLNVECPEGNCDDWDRGAHIDIKAPDGNWIQLIRYITPYNVACNHQLDVTDYASLLQGDVELRMFIDTWGTGGWQITLDLEHQKGTPEYRYSRVDEIWDATYDFGNPDNKQPVEVMTHQFGDNVERAYLRLSNTGHGWGDNNTDNAAEFYNATHSININNQIGFDQNLWNNCDPNPDNCLAQQGTWRFDRAGWCLVRLVHPIFST